MYMRRLKTAAAAAAILAIAGTAATTAAAQDARDYLLATASTGGTYYPVGVALSTLIKVKLQPKQKINVSAISSAGSGENIKLLRENEVQFAILQGLYGVYAAKGTGPVASAGPQKNLRSISMLWPNVDHFLVMAKDAKTGTIDDLVALKGQGKKVSMGAKNSGTLGSNETLMTNLGVDIEKDFELAYMGYGPTAEALQNGTIDAASMPAGVPVGGVTQAFAALGNKIRLLTFTPEQARKADGGLNLWTEVKIPANTYPGQDYDVTTVEQPNFLAVRDDVAEDVVYLITKTMYENLAFLNGIHAATKEMSIGRAINGLPLPLHPGALKYYKEAGVKVPDHLMAK